MDLKYGLRSHLPLISMMKFDICFQRILSVLQPPTMDCDSQNFQRATTETRTKYAYIILMCYLHFSKRYAIFHYGVEMANINDSEIYRFACFCFSFVDCCTLQNWPHFLFIGNKLICILYENYNLDDRCLMALCRVCMCVFRRVASFRIECLDVSS